jgi:anti-sigma regulatory factor (Ser/Thr protein kinase)
MGDRRPDRDAELLASEVVTNAALHAPGAPIGFAVRLDSGDGGQRGVTCEVTDRSPTLPKIRQARPSQEHGRGMAIVNALAAATGVQVGPTGKTTWFTLAVNRIARQAELDPEAGAWLTFREWLSGQAGSGASLRPHHLEEQ